MMAATLDGTQTQQSIWPEEDGNAITSKTSESEDPSFKKLVEIDPVGDVYLVLQTFKLRVSSKALSLASNVFAVMFQPSFREGTTLAKNDTCDVPLPDDDEKSMHALCILFHHRHPDSITYEINAQFLHETAILVDKYACADAVYLWADFHLTKLGSRSSRPENEDAQLLHAAYGFNNCDQFKNITRRMVFSSSPWPLTSEFRVPTWGLDDEVQILLPQGLLGTIAYHERTLKRNILEKLETLPETLLGKKLGGSDRIAADCVARGDYGRMDLASHHPTLFSECDCNRIGVYLWKLKDAGLWPFSRAYREQTLGSIIFKAQWTFLGRSNDTNAANCQTCKFSTTITTKVRDYASSIHSSFSGLCLDCVKYRSCDDEEPYECRIKHEGFMGIKVFNS